MRVYMSWFLKKERTIEERSLPLGSRLSKTPQHTYVFYENTDVEFEQLKHLYASFQRQGLHCIGVNLYLPGSVPNLSKYGFKENNGMQTYLKSIVPISAFPYGTHEWCYMIRSERGVPMRALNALPYFQELQVQMTLDLPTFEGSEQYVKNKSVS